MGAGLSVDHRHARIWANLSSIQAPEARLQMLDTLLSGSEYVAVAKRYNVYASLLQWKAATQRGEFAIWPSAQASPAPRPSPPVLPRAPPPISTPNYQRPPSNRIVSGPPTLTIEDHRHPATSQQLARIPPPKRALDALNDAYAVLDIDDGKPLTHDALRVAYNRAAIRVHPDKGGSPEAFDAVTKAFLYIQEVLEKLIPKTATDGSDPRFTAPVTREAALKARGIATTHAAPTNALQIEDRAPIALNPKKLDMTVFNKLFEENRLPDPEKDDGYGSWLSSQEPVRGTTQQQMRGKYNADVFNKMFVEEAQRSGPPEKAASTAMSAYRPPSELVLAPGFGAELGGERPAQYTKAPASGGIGYTDLKFAYGEGSTFSQEVATATTDGRPQTLEEAKRAYGAPPKPLSADEAAAVAAFDKAKEAAEIARQRRVAARDVDADTLHTRMKTRLMIQ